MKIISNYLGPTKVVPPARKQNAGMAKFIEINYWKIRKYTYRNFKITDDQQHPNAHNSRRKYRIHAVLGWLCSSQWGLSNKPKIIEIQSQDPKLALRAGTLLCHIMELKSPWRSLNANISGTTHQNRTKFYRHVH